MFVAEAGFGRDKTGQGFGEGLETIRHLDGETQMGVVRMSVEMDQGSDKGAQVSHKCCNMYGRPANETVGLLDCYTDLNAGAPDNE